MYSTFVLIAFSTVIVCSFGTHVPLGQDCETAENSKEMKVFGAARIQDYMLLMTEIKLADAQDVYKRVIFQLLYNGYGDIDYNPDSKRPTLPPDVLPPDYYPYFDLKQFEEFNFTIKQPNNKMAPSPDPSVQGIFEQMFIFSTDYMQVVDKQKTSELVYINDTNGVTVYQFEVKGDIIKCIKSETIQSERLDANREPSSDMFLFHLFGYFPPELKINAILIVEKPKDMYKNQDNFGTTDREYIALIYATMNLKGVDYRFRLRIITSGNADQKGLHSWSLDENHNFCDELEVNVTAAVHLHDYYPNIYQRDGSVKKSHTKDTYFLEFSNIHHRVMKMHYNNQTKQLYIEQVQTDPALNNEAWINNTKLISCRKDPYSWDNSTVKCRDSLEYEQYPYDQIPGLQNEPNDPYQLPIGSSDKGRSSNNYWVMVGCIAVLIAVVIVLAFGWFVMTTGSKESQ